MEVRLYAPLNGSKLFRGKLLELGESGEVRIESATGVMEFPRNTVAKLMTYFEF